MVPFRPLRSALAGAVAFALFAAPSPSRADANGLLALQPLAHSEAVTLPDGTELRLIDLNPTVGLWWLLEARSPHGGSRWAHLEVPPGVAKPKLGDAGLLVRPALEKKACPLDGPDGIFAERKVPRTPVCGSGILVLHTVRGWRTTLETATDTLRSDFGSVGESLITMVKDHIHDDTETAHYGSDGDDGDEGVNGPSPAALSPNFQGRSMSDASLGIPPAGVTGTMLRVGAWYPARDVPGAFVSVATPEAIAGPGRAPDAEAGGTTTVYLMAFDLTYFSIGYAIGYEHPNVEWSPRLPHPDTPGPDGIADLHPLERPASVPTWQRDRLAAAFVGGFQRKHAGFRPGANPPGSTNGGHYGVVEDGVIESRLQPGLATLWAKMDGVPEIGTMTAEMAGEPPNGLLFARQNGLPLVEDGRIGARVADPNGNWSGDASGRVLSLRSAACILERGDKRFLAFAMFTAALPPSMARTLVGYGCKQAIHLDMNAAELAYAAAYAKTPDGIVPEVLYKPMHAADPPHGRKFVEESDRRDFFWLVRRDPSK